MRISIDRAVQLLSCGNVVGVPTETVYGLAASLHHPKAVANIFSLKKRPLNNPLIVHLASADAVMSYATSLPEGMSDLMRTFWPGPLTCVLEVNVQTIPEVVRAGLTTAAFRVPGDALTRRLLAETGPLVMPSANLSGKPSATMAQHVEHDFGEDFPVLDGGECGRGVESTILFFEKERWIVIRLGALPPEAFEKTLGYCPVVVEKRSQGAPLCPGQSYRHYSPEAKLKLARVIPSGIDAIVGFIDREYSARHVFHFGCSDQPEEAIKRLYAVLRSLDDAQINEAWVDIDFPRGGLWETLRERLQRAQEV